MREFTMEERIRRVWDKEDIRALLCRNAYYQASNERRRALDELWVREPDHTATASYGKNWGYYVGMDEIARYYVENNPFGGVGTAICHPVCTIRVMVAEDGRTAQAMWYDVSYETQMKDGKPDSLWIAEKVSADLVRETGGWKIWHYFAGVDLYTAPGGSYNDLPIDIPPEEDPVAQEFGTPTLPMEAYINRYNFYPYPAIPEPYETYSEAMGCGPEGNPKYKAEEAGK